MVKTYFDDEGYEYTASNHRLRYNPELHENNGKRWTDEELQYLCQMRPTMKYKDLSLALGRTQGVCASKYYYIKKAGLVDYYKNINLEGEE
ncbi:hypothetical protein [Clostridium sp. Ade.TY]|uniref:hypothetical protein n=1 Tax=Clostridium sp. Ade.TY TaxID=1391647 RepID=UPI000426430D|nr:hypothetical protein [Clostridium sp. Ade.TY]